MDKSNQPVISVVSPAFNEAEVIADVVKEWIEVLEEDGRDWEIVITDDGSSDGTSEALKKLDEPRLRVVRFETNHGYGYALSAAMAAAKGEYQVTIDSDGQFDLRDFPGLLKKLESEGLDLVTGYRLKKDDTFVKVAGDRVLNLIVRILFWLNLKDTNCALKVMKRDVAKAINIEAISFPTPTEIVVRASQMGFRVGEAPVNHRERAGGQSKLKVLRGSFEFLIFLSYLRSQLFLIKWKLIQGSKI
jgi:glycosyltransferase involved in cell wall biosynthesis